jgi:Protein of unknown function (DUF3833)
MSTHPRQVQRPDSLHADLRRRFSQFLTTCAMTIAMVLGLVACASQDLAKYQKEQPALDLKAYFNGPVTAYGVFQDRSGQVVRRFTVQMNCSWVGDVGTLDEHFTYADGTKERRVWTITKTGAQSYTGKAGDVIGQADGQSAGNALNWKYTLSLPVDGKIYEVQFDDWMYLVNDKVMLNRAVMSKFGLRLGEVLLSFTKP